jgi:integrase
MASISNDPGGRRRLLFLGPDGTRKTVRLGKVTARVAGEVKARVEAILAAASAGVSIDEETARWLAGIGEQLHAKLAAAGLAAPRQAPETPMALTLGAWLERYLAGRSDVKATTRRNFESSRARLVAFFGADKPLAAITPGDADGFALWLKGKYAPGTAARTVRRAAQFFKAAARHHVIAASPFTDVKLSGGPDRSKLFFVTPETAARVLDALADPDGRLIFALSRFGGLRCPSEHLALRWAEIDWERGRFLVRSPKTEHHEGKATRWVPIFPELLPFLEEAFERARPGAVHVLECQSGLGRNFRRPLERAIIAAGLTAWPRLFHNLRASRETELAAAHPIHVVCAWIGNSPQIAAKHYLQVTDADFDRAAQKAAQQDAETGRKGSQGYGDRSAETAQFPSFAGTCETLRDGPAVSPGPGRATSTPTRAPPA